MPPETYLRGLARFLGAALALAIAALFCLNATVRALIPVITSGLDAIDTTYRTVSISLVDVNGEPILQRIAGIRNALVIGESVLYPHKNLVFSTGLPAGIVLLPAVLGLSLAFAWPSASVRELFVRLCLCLPLLALVTALDAPLLLYGGLWAQAIQMFEPERWSLLAYWPDFMNAGGRYALTLVAVASAVSIALRVTRLPGRKGN